MLDVSSGAAPQAQEGGTSFRLSPIKAIELAASKIPGAVSLAQGIPSFRTPEAIKQFVAEKMQAGLVDKYSLTNGLSELREEIALRLERDGLKYDPDSEIIVTAGSIEGITASVLAHTEPGDEVLVPSPTYTSYQGAIGLARCTPRFFELDEDHNFDFHVERIERAITRKTKLILYCSPNNPTGTLFSEAKTRELIKLAERHDLTVLIDEVYKDFYYTDDQHFTPCSIPEARSRVVRVCSFSKAYAMTGWRVGFVHADRQRIRNILRFHDAMVTCAPVISQYAAIAALRFCDDYLTEFRAEFKRRRDFTIQKLDQLSHVLDYQVPRATYFVFPRIKDIVPLAHNSTALAYDILEKAKLALVPGVAFGPSGESHLRISYGREWADLELGMTRLQEYFSAAMSSRRSSSTPILASPKTPVSSPHVESSPSALASAPRPRLRRRAAQLVLGAAARLWIKRNKPTIIGIAGIRGKTVFKRSLVQLFRAARATRGSVLSYNTETGLPLSVLGLTPPRTPGQLLRFPLELIRRTLARSVNPELLILEYGMARVEDAKILAAIAKPDWLVISDLSSPDPSIEGDEYRKAILALAENVPKNRVLWPQDDSWLESDKGRFDAALGFSISQMHAKQMDTPQGHYTFSRDLVGQSAQRSALAAVRLGELLDLPKSALETFLNSDASFERQS